MLKVCFFLLMLSPVNNMTIFLVEVDVG